MKLELQAVGEEQVPVIILDCDECGAPISICESELNTTRPVPCTICDYKRSVTYREYVTFTDRYAATLLGLLLGKYRKGGTSCHPC